MQSYHGKLLLWQHVHTQPYFFESLVSLLLWIVFFIIWVWSSPCGWDCFCPAIRKNELHISSNLSVVCMNLYLHICYLSHFFIFVYMWFSSTAYFIFPHFFEYFLHKFGVNDLDDLYTDISFIIVSYFVYTYYYTHVLLFHEIFQCFS